MDYLTVAFFRFDHGLKTFFPSSDVLLNACIPTTHVPFGTFLNVAVTVTLSVAVSFVTVQSADGTVMLPHFTVTLSSFTDTSALDRLYLSITHLNVRSAFNAKKASNHIRKDAIESFFHIM